MPRLGQPAKRSEPPNVVSYSFRLEPLSPTSSLALEYSIATRPWSAYRAGMVPKVRAPYSFVVSPADGGELAPRVASFAADCEV